MTHSERPALLPALTLAVGIALAGWFIAGALRQFRAADRYVSVRGLAEQEVAANLAIWPISFTVSGSDLSALQTRLEQDERTVVTYLETLGFSQDEVSAAAPRVNDNAQGGMIDGRVVLERYQVQGTVTLRTKKVEDAKRAIQRSGELVKKGVRVIQSWDGTTQFLYTDLEKIKPAMIADATKDARRAAEQFANDSAAQVGAIRRAQQGLFSIEDLDANTPHRKKVRVVTTVDYFLVGD
jgi:hypothetical protein